MEVWRNSFHFQDWVGNLSQLPQPGSDNEELEWEESEVLWSATSTSLPLHYSPRNKLAANIVTVVRTNLCSRDLLSDVETGKSAPLKVPSWSSWMCGVEEAEDKADPTTVWSQQGEMSLPVPPHVISGDLTMTRTRTMAFSVLEGVGRTLKGRDLRRVRDGVLRKKGFLD